MLADVGRVWRHRERIELEAADQFERLAVELAALGAGEPVVELARRAAADERDHARRCRRLVDRFAPDLAPLAPSLGEVLGPPELSRRRRALYACVALSCVTETLSVALLCHMRTCARDALVRETVDHILRDEVAHSRLGWAQLAAEARCGDVTWLAPHVDGMMRAAVTSDAAPMIGRCARPEYGVLAGVDVAQIVAETEALVIRPGLARYGVTARTSPCRPRTAPPLRRCTPAR